MLQSISRQKRHHRHDVSCVLTIPTKQRTSESGFHTSQGPKNGVKSAWITSVISIFNPTTLLKTHSNEKDDRMDVITMGSCSFPLNGVMVVLVFARFFCEFIIYYIDDSAGYLRDTMPSNNEYHEGYLSLEDQDEMNRNESMGEGNGEVRRTSSALDGFDASASLPRNKSHRFAYS